MIWNTLNQNINSYMCKCVCLCVFKLKMRQWCGWGLSHGRCGLFCYYSVVCADGRDLSTKSTHHVLSHLSLYYLCDNLAFSFNTACTRLWIHLFTISEWQEINYQLLNFMLCLCVYVCVLIENLCTIKSKSSGNVFI